MRTGANILWFLLGGWLLAALWYAAAAFMTLTVVGLPWLCICVEIGTMCLMPFGLDVVAHDAVEGPTCPGGTEASTAAKIIWAPFAGLLALTHLLHGLLLCATVIGIPLARRDLYLARIAMLPVGRRVVSIELMEAIRAGEIGVDGERLNTWD